MFAGSVVVVTGASSGVGRAVAVELAAAGASVALVGRDRTTLPVNECSAVGHGVFRPYVADLEREGEIVELASTIERDFGATDVLVHSAGVIISGNVERASSADFDRQYWCNVRGPWILTQRLLPGLIKQAGQVVFLNSSLGLSARAGVSQYAATKHALRAVADSLRDEVNATGMRVLSVYLGQTATPMQARLYRESGRRYRPERLIQPKDVALLIASTLALPRTIEVTDITVRPRAAPLAE